MRCEIITNILQPLIGACHCYCKLGSSQPGAKDPKGCRCHACETGENCRYNIEGLLSRRTLDPMHVMRLPIVYSKYITTCLCIQQLPGVSTELVAYNKTRLQRTPAPRSGLITAMDLSSQVKQESKGGKRLPQQGGLSRDCICIKASRARGGEVERFPLYSKSLCARNPFRLFFNFLIFLIFFIESY